MAGHSGGEIWHLGVPACWSLRDAIGSCWGSSACPASALDQCLGPPLHHPRRRCPKFPDSSACGFFKWAGPQGQQAVPYQSQQQHRQQQQQWEHPLYPSPSQQPSPWQAGPSQQAAPWQAGPSQQAQQQQWQSPPAQALSPAPRYVSPLALQQWQGGLASPSAGQPAWGGTPSQPMYASPAQQVSGGLGVQAGGAPTGGSMYGPPPQVLQQQLEQRRQQHQQQWQQGADYGGPPLQQGGSQPHPGQQGWGGAGPATPHRPPSQQQPGWGSPPGSQRFTQGSPPGSQRLTQGSPPAGSPGGCAQLSTKFKRQLSCRMHPPNPC